MSPDTASSLFPDRPIRPLPKRRLREKLSPEVAESIKYPPSDLRPIPLFQYPPYSVKEDVSSPRGRSSSPTEQTHGNTPHTNGFGSPSPIKDEGEADSRGALVTRLHPEAFSRSGVRPGRSEDPRQTNPQPPPSTDSSVDGYDSFENTNNKKKRKIPSAGDSTLNSVHGLGGDLNQHLSGSGAASGGDLNGDKAHTNGAGYSASGSLGANSHGISGSGRGRLGRSRSGRSPLRALSDGSNTWAGRQSKGSTPQWAASEYQGSGIISNAIANAEKLPPQGQENVSLLQQHSAAAKSAPASTQFTFTCDSQVPGSLQWPGNPARPGMGGQQSTEGNREDVPDPSDPPPKGATRGTGNSRRKERRRLEKELNMAARHRRQAAHDNYMSNPPAKDDIWICEFCEYEQIFGEPPRALIREYEIADRRVRQEEADRKRLLEKAKAKGRKAKKAGKAAAAKGQGTNLPADQQPADGEAPPIPQSQGQSTQSEDDYEDDYAVDYDSGGGGGGGGGGSSSGTGQLQQGGNELPAD